jgi:MoxR-like ATPase
MPQGVDLTAAATTQTHALLDSVDSIETAMAERGYIGTAEIATAVYLACQLRKPVLIEGEPGVGKTELAKTVATMLQLPIFRLQCYEGLDEARALYEWKYSKQLLYTQMLRDRLGSILHQQSSLNSAVEQLLGFGDLFYSEGFLEPRPILRALREPAGAVLLIDEIDKADFEFEALLLEVLADYQISIPEIGTVRAVTTPLVFLTSNDQRPLSDALKRRCLHLHIPFPDMRLEKRIVASRIPGIEERLLGAVVAFVQSLRKLDLRKPPSVAETIDWARSLILLHVSDLDPRWVERSLNVLLKFEDDLTLARRELPKLLAAANKA